MSVNRNVWALVAAGGVLAWAATGACAKTAESQLGHSSKTSESSVTTNDNGSVSRLFSESTVTTNGNLVTERRRETRTTMDMHGNVLETSTSEYAQSYPAGDAGAFQPRTLAMQAAPAEAAAEPAPSADSFLSLKFGTVFQSDELVPDVAEPEYLRAKFTPAKPLAGFDDYWVYVTPKTHRVAKVYACAKNAVEPGSRWRRHYLIEALEKRYGTWARLCSWRRPCYAFEIGAGRHLSACLADATSSYETVIAAWDDAMSALAADEREQLREEARKTAAEKRGRRVSAAMEAF